MIKVISRCDRCKKEQAQEFGDTESAIDFISSGFLTAFSLCRQCTDGLTALDNEFEEKRKAARKRYMNGKD